MSDYRGNIELVETSSDFTLIWGWIGNPNITLKKPSLAVYSNDVEGKVNYPYFREDLVEAGIPNGLGGFMAYFAKPFGQNEVLSAKVKINGTDALGINRSNFSIREFEPRAGFRGAGKAGVFGWIFDPHFDLNAPRTKLRIDNDIVVDIKSFDLIKTEAFDRFEFHVSLDEITLSARAQQKNISYLVDKPNKIELLYQNKVVSDGMLEVRTSIVGRVEDINSEFIRGWAVDREAPNEPVTLDIMLDGCVHQTIKANIARQDLMKRGISEYSGGFRFNMPSSSVGKSAKVSVSVIVTISGKILPIINKDYPKSTTNIDVTLKSGS